MIGFILNIPYTIVGLVISLISIPTKLEFRKNPYAFMVKVKKFWWVFGYVKNARAVVIGHVVIFGSNLEDKDLEHELIHVEQYQRMPLIQPILYYIELIRKGYKNNKYEDEAYRKAGNIYKGK
ncbi:MAG: hypothetical protein A2566_02315 [Candidatus Zambryskibacteria bacterium RIFOXYD1_FULL_40_13]|nr:MAG: hypothetical protein UT25_C0003G0024 [Parcubacteria group bacterium GW2011_GWC1_39_12]KKR19048.1 MAG: hypothetical protein UT49_C0004G0028 [Parcubacteria group bacterium GW2011_GWF1_39_37]KKR35615.1 MAG: hypothetical protein UT68_C0002G0041 [Parcubacteria group bacterium GW2011_GWC2_40_10]KKR52026.1 MAG: hypothetical protein UT89_C0004G0112 [Parcubacteria group bacterium GW2011_GWE1_40_20]KKR65997.1 MAG: hypothetical protein UU06_C0007G0004 [Parcubacteria group bacterium GW2011_GWB1_40_